jgi:predicted transposase YbfD/YdcC
MLGGIQRGLAADLSRAAARVPTQDVFLAVFAALDPQAFSKLFLSWMELLVVRLKALDKHIAVDGKTSRRSFERSKQRPAVHMVSAWLSEAGLVLGQTKTREKSNEIKAIPELLSVIDIRGSTITIDAMGCQTDIAALIKDRGGDYLLAVKDNQPTLHNDIQESFQDAFDDSPRPQDQPAALPLESWSSTDKGHGRLEERTVYVCRDLSWLYTASNWSGLSYIALAVSKRTDLGTGKTSTENRYFIGSGVDVSVEQIGQLIRRHWGIENGLHWVLDMAFHEDQARQRSKHCAENLATLRHFALNLVKNTPKRKLGVANTRKQAGWSRDVLVRILEAWGG